MVRCDSGKVLRAALALLLGGAFVAEATMASAEVRSSTVNRSYSVGGTTASGLVTYMKSHPLRGDRGAAVANIRPDYTLAVATKSGGDGCQASNVTLKVRFTMTLPRAKSVLKGTTRSAWNSFVAFAKRHEETHRRIYVGCANSFISKAQRVSAKSCLAVKAEVRNLLEAEKRACDRKHAAFDRREYQRLLGLSLFRMARSRSASR